jgi:hypothetical protein
MLLDLSVPTSLYALPLILIGICLVVYGREILEVLSFPIGAVAGGVLAYMILKGFLEPYDINPLVEVLVAGVMVFVGGIMGPGTMVMVVAVIISVASIDVMDAFMGWDQVVSWILGALVFAVIIYPVQKYLAFSSAITGGILISVGIFVIFDGADPILRTGIQLVIIVIMGVAGGIFQTWLKRKMDSRKEEVLWIPTLA